jgi:NCAIR mutase (PurE)-related protein
MSLSHSLGDQFQNSLDQDSLNQNSLSQNSPKPSPESADQVRHLLNAVATGDISPDQALESLRFWPSQAVGDFARIDTHRPFRTGFPEAIWGPGKSPDQIIEIMQAMQQRGSLALATRIPPEVAATIQQRIPTAHYSKLARLCWIPALDPPPERWGQIGVISAGTADLPVAEEAALTVELAGFRVQRLWDVGVAGIHRLLQNQALLTGSDVLIVVAGMEGALASVVGGLSDCPVVAVPTSVGYGASFGGVAALLTMLNSCAAGIGVVNIDNGFGAAILAGQILRRAALIKAAPVHNKM